MMEKKCLIVYFGNGYSENVLSHNLEYYYSVDMRENKENHYEKIYQPLYDLGYKIDNVLVTNKHEHYDEFVKEYSAIPVFYDEITKEDEDNLYNYYALKVPKEHGPGSLRSGGRFLKLVDKLPEYDQYVFIRADVQFKVKLTDLKVDFEKINYLWPETDYRLYTDLRQSFMDTIKTEKIYWNQYYRVNGNVLNVVPKKYINIFLTYFWLEHVSLYMMFKELEPLITYEKDVNLMCGEDTCYVSDIRYCENPIYTFNKKIIKENV
jgi:hypothetical protein